jgi:hypothetical protein
MQLTMLAKSPSIKKMTIVHACVSVPAEHSTLRALLCGSLPAAAGLLPAGRAAVERPTLRRGTAQGGGGCELTLVCVCMGGAGPVRQRLQPIYPLQPSGQHLQVGKYSGPLVSTAVACADSRASHAGVGGLEPTAPECALRQGRCGMAAWGPHGCGEVHCACAGGRMEATAPKC